MNPEIQQAIELWENGQEAEAFPMFLKYKDSDDADALAYLGRSYFSGSGIEQDYAKAFEYFSKAAELGQPYGLNGMGVLYRNGDGVKQDLQLAEKYLLQASEAGCPLAEFNLGVLYEGVYYDLAKGVPSIPDFGNVTKALEHYRASYDAGNLKSQCAMDIGELLLKGETPADAIPWLQEAAANDQWRALARLAVMYDGGDLVPIDNNLAIDYAERLGNVTDLWNLYAENCYRMGLEYLCKNQSREALMFLQEAADKGNADAQFYLSWIHPDEASRGKYAWMAVQNGNRLVLVQAGTYLAGQKQYDEAMKCYQEAAKDGDLLAMCELAIMHRLGEGVPIDYEKSMEWYAKAAEQYYPRAL
ncbi:MAG: sel1 repeat family protein, partial [Kiritimatiellae bacterium]|nr:sel1 repeat family protein [Kiritimatiellia bacterium]